MKCLLPERIKEGQRGFTLLELLVVVAILAAIAFIAAGTYKGVAERTDESLVRTEMLQIAQALRQFRQDTGYFPGEGVFRLSDDGGAIPSDSVTGADLAEKRQWLYSPANFYQLLDTTSPLPATHLLAAWNRETGRGWRGPYLTGFREGQVKIGDGINPPAPNAADNVAGDPLQGTAVTVDGIADPFEHQQGADGLLGWSGVPANERWGRPYLFLRNAAGRWLLISMGPDGEYGNGDDIALAIE